MQDRFYNPLSHPGFASEGFVSRQVVPQASGVALPAWLTHAWEALSAGVADGVAVTSQADAISSVVAESAGTAKPTYRADYLTTGVSAYEYDGVDDIATTATNVNLTAGYTYCALVYFPSPLANFRVLYETGVSETTQGAVYCNGGATLSLAERDGTVTQLNVASGATTGEWQVITAIHNGASTEILRNRVSRGTGTVTNPTTAQPIRFGRGTGILAPGGMKGGIAAHYFGPPATPTQLTELWDYINARCGVSL